MVEKIVTEVLVCFILIGGFYLIVRVSNYFGKRDQCSSDSSTPVGNYPTYEELQQMGQYQIVLNETLPHILPIVSSEYPNKILLYSGMSLEERNRYETNKIE